MTIINKHTKVSEIVISEPSTLTVLNRFGIYLGFGDKTVSDICVEKNIDSEFFVSILNTYINENYFPEEALKSYSIKLMFEYFNKTNQYYQRVQLPNIERHFNSFVERSEQGNKSLELLREFFNEVKNELMTRIDIDTKIFDENTTFQNSIGHLNEESDSIEDKLNDLINMFVIHLKGNYDTNLCHAVLFSILSLKKDISQNNRLRYRILLPLLKSN